MLTLSDLAAESQAVLRLEGSRVMVINNTDKKKERKEKEGKLEVKKNYTVNISNKYIDLDKKGMRYLCKRNRKGSEGVCVCVWGGGNVCLGLGPSNGSCSTAPSLLRRGETAAPRRPGAGP